jgi:type I restriction enzyme S subunit
MELINQSLNIKKLQDITLDMHQGINTVTEKVEYLQEGIPILQSKHITKGFLNINDTKYLSESDYFKYKEKYQAKIDDLLICNIGTIGSSLRIEKEEKFLIAWNLFLVKLNKDLVYSGYLAHYFNYLKSKNYFDRFLTGGTVKFINKKTMQKIPVPLPKLATQKKIAAILDEADKIRQLNKQLIVKYDALTQSLFLDMFGDTWLNPKKWDWKLVEELALDRKHSIKAGPFGSSLKKEFYVESGYKIYGQEQVIKDNLSFGDYYVDEKKYQSLKACKVDYGDILISLVGTYGKIAIVPEVFEKGIINPRLMKISPNQKIIRPDFLKILLQGSGSLIQMKNKSRGGTMDIVNVGIMRKIRVPVPPIKLQNQFAERNKIIENQKQQAQEALQKSEDLFNSLLQKAFKGELVK